MTAFERRVELSWSHLHFCEFSIEVSQGKMVGMTNISARDFMGGMTEHFALDIFF